MPARLDKFIEQRLYGNSGYYSVTANTSRDFYTAPERYPAFNRLIAFVAARIAERNGVEHFQLVDLGSGQGELAAEFERSVPAARSVAVEISPLRRQLIARKTRKTLILPSITGIAPDLPSIIIANEFFDSLPVRAVKKTGGLIHECFIENNRPVFKPSCEDLPAEVVELLDSLPEDFVVEFEPYTFELASFLSRFSMVYLLVIDYGFGGEEILNFPGGTLTGYQNHRFLNEPIGEAAPVDITHHVNFDLMNKVFKSNRFETAPLLSMGRFVTSVFENHHETPVDLRELKDMILPGRMADEFRVFSAARGFNHGI